MMNLSNKSFIIAQSLCVALIACSMLLDIPWYLKYYIFPIVPLGFMILLAIQKVNETCEQKIDAYIDTLQIHRNDKEWLDKELLEVSKKCNYVAFNRIHKGKYEVLKTYLKNLSQPENRSSDSMTSENINTQLSLYPGDATPVSPQKVTVDDYNSELYNKTWQFLDCYIATTLSAFFSVDDITTIKQSVFEFFINDRRKIEVANKVVIPQYLSMQDVAHFFHNISELMSYYKKLKQADFFKYLSCFIDLKDYDPQSLYRNSTRTSTTSSIPLCRISEEGNIISDFVKEMRTTMPYNQRIIS